jgi:hypothetical protein
MKQRHVLAFFSVFALIGSISILITASMGSASQSGPLRFEIELSAAAFEGIAELGLETPITGRAFVIVTRDGEREPRAQARYTGVPLWAMDVANLQPGDSFVIDSSDATVLGYPLEDFSELPADDYFVQAFLNVYTTFHRADGNVVQMHLNSGAGQSMFRAPGNAHSAVQQVRLDAATSGTVELSLSEVIAPIEPPGTDGILQQGNPSNGRLVKFVKIQSEVLSEFWGHPMYIGANVLLPESYENSSDVRYPVAYMQGHFPGRRAPFSFREPGTEDAQGGPQRGGRSAGFSEHWLSDDAPQVIGVSFRDANPYYDTAYSVDSANVGPYGTALTEELIPYLEEQFRMIPESWGRVLAGGSTGGWEALGMQIFYPEYFGGTWGWCPDPVDFNYHQIANIYDDDNAYWLDRGWVKLERPNTRRPDGNITSTMRMENLFEHVVGPDSRSGGQWAIWEATFGPVGPNGFPWPIWDHVTGDIDHEVAEYWREHFDLNNYLQQNWSSIGPSLRGQIHVAVGDMDTYYLEQAVYLLEEFLQSVDPPAEAEFQYGRKKPHCWTGYSPVRPGEDMNNQEFLRIIADHIAKNAPEGTDISGWYR